MFYACSHCEMRADSSFIDSGLPSCGCRGEPGGSSLSFASPKESNQRKGDPQSGSLRCAAGNLRCSKSAEFLETSRLRRRRTSKNFDPLPPALLSPARTGWENKCGFGLHSLSLRERAGAERCGSRCASAHLDSVKKPWLCQGCGLQDRASPNPIAYFLPPRPGWA